MISFVALEMNVHCLEGEVWAGRLRRVGGGVAVRGRREGERNWELGGRVGSVRKGGEAWSWKGAGLSGGGWPR